MLWGELRNPRGEKPEFVRIERPKKIIICKNWNEWGQVNNNS